MEENMFYKMKELWELKKRAEEIKNELEKLDFTSEDNLTSVTVKGTLEVSDVKIKVDLQNISKEKIEKSLVENINKSMRNAQLESAKRAFDQFNEGGK